MEQQEKIYSERFGGVLQRAQETQPHRNSQAIPEILTMMNALHAEDFQLSSLMSSLNREWDWNTKTLYSQGDIHAGLFMVPKGNSIPLHDHPDMTVFFRVLWGHLQIKTYDWDERYPFEGLAELKSDQTLDGSAPTQLVTPNSENIHSIFAHSDCAFVDLFAPPYCKDSGRICSNYLEKAWIERDGERLMLLEKITNS